MITIPTATKSESNIRSEFCVYAIGVMNEFNGYERTFVACRIDVVRRAVLCARELDA